MFSLISIIILLMLHHVTKERSEASVGLDRVNLGSLSLGQNVQNIEKTGDLDQNGFLHFLYKILVCTLIT